MKMDNQHVRVVLAGRPRQTSQTNSDVRRRVYTPSLTIPRPLIRRPSLDSSAVLKSRPLIVKHDTTVKTDPPPLFRAHSFRDVIVRDSVPRKQTKVPAATKLTHEPEIKPILKSGKGTYVIQTPELSVQSSPMGFPRHDGRFCYKLPDRPAVKLRKSVSFKEDRLSGSHKSYHRQYSSPPLSLPTSVHDDTDTQIFV